VRHLVQKKLQQIELSGVYAVAVAVAVRLTEFCPVPELVENLSINRQYWQELFDSGDAMR